MAAEIIEAEKFLLLRVGQELAKRERLEGEDLRVFFRGLPARWRHSRVWIDKAFAPSPPPAPRAKTRQPRKPKRPRKRGCRVHEAKKYPGKEVDGMKRKPDDPDFRRLQGKEVAAAFGVSPQAVSAWHRKYGCPRNPDGTYSLPAVLRWTILKRMEKLEGPPPSAWLDMFRADLGR
jgi:hypothetical protein